MNSIPVIFNPSARGARARGEKLARLSERVSLHASEAPGHARELARQLAAEGHATIVAAGGDGTVNEVVNGIAGTGAILGILPVGTMNVFATDLKLPCDDLHRCWQVIESGRCRRVDMARVNGSHHFVQLAGVGLDAQVVLATSWTSKKTFGPLSYLFSAAQIAGRKPPKLLVKCPGKTREGSFVLIGNGRFYGGPFPVFNRARMDDGLLDVLVFENLGFFDIARYLHGILFGTHGDLPDVDYFQTGELHITSEENVPMEVDGEVIGEVPAHFEVVAGGLQVLA